MTVFRPRLHGLVSKLALFYVLLSLPTLVIVESAILSYEFHRFASGVKDSSLHRATQRGAQELDRYWPYLQPGSNGEAITLKLWLDSWVLRLQQPRGGLTPDESYVLLELSEAPVGAAVVTADARVLAQSSGNQEWILDLPTAIEVSAALQQGFGKASELAGREDSLSIQRVLVPLSAGPGAAQHLLFAELRVPPPWRHLLIDASFESPVIFAFLIVFGLASSIFLAAWVTRRLSRIARAATAWSRGDFSDRIDDRSSDEIGGLSAMLNGMALDLKSLLRSRAQLATLAERQRLARDLHDTVKQKAFALNLQLATVRRMLGAEGGGERLEGAQRLTRQIQEELGQILDELRPKDSELPFAERIRMRANDWSHTSSATVGFAIEEIRTLAPATEDSLLRVVDEALSNVLRHSGATHVDLALRREAERVNLVITDNGKGAAADHGNGMGLRNMRERIEMLPGGRFEFSSEQGRGTRITASFKIEEPR
jgi:signal transduction histidine kinase